MPDHDHAYKKLFSHPQMVEDLLRGFVKEDWVAQLDYPSLEKVSASYVSDDLREREDDLIWRVRWGSNWVYVYLLLEFQSTVDHHMAVRLLTYVGLLYQDLIEAKQLLENRNLPPVLPVVLYNGGGRWTASQDISDLIETLPGGLARYQPRLHYLLLDEGRYSEAELAPLKNLVAALFRLENSRTPEDIITVLSSLVNWLSTPEQASLRRAFTVWIKRVLLPARLPGKQIPQIEDLSEVKVMLAERVVEWTRDWKQQGYDEGREEGRKEEAELILTKQLTQRFGPLPEWAGERLAQASPRELESWAERVLVVERLEDVFEG